MSAPGRNEGADRTLEVLLVDDDRRARMEILRMLRNHPEVRVVGEAADLEHARQLLAEIRPHAVFLDMELGPGRGTELLTCIQAETEVVVITAHPEFAVEAFGFHALDYLVKPVEAHRLAMTLERLVQVVWGVNPDAAPAVGPVPDAPICFRDGKTVHQFNPSQLVCIEALGYLTRLTVTGGGCFLISRSIGEWLLQLPTPPFLRLDRSLIINLDRVASFATQDRDETSLQMQDVAQPLQLGRTASAKLRAALRRPHSA